MRAFALFERIVQLSKSKNWEEARKEWRLMGINRTPESQTCLCGHHPIKELCLIQNMHNYIQVIIGNCCINKFFDFKVEDNVFRALKKGKLNKALILFAREQKIISDIEKAFLLNVHKKKRFSEKQFNWYRSLSEKIFQGVKYE